MNSIRIASLLRFILIYESILSRFAVLGLTACNLFQGSEPEISSILALANQNLIPVTPRGSGTNISGGSIPVRGGIVLCTTKMNRVLEINAANLTATVEPGVVLHDFNTLLAKENLFYPPDRQSFLSCTLGGTVAENSGGPLCIKYGVTKQYVLGLEVVLPDCHVMKAEQKQS